MEVEFNLKLTLVTFALISKRKLLIVNYQRSKMCSLVLKFVNLDFLKIEYFSISLSVLDISSIISKLLFNNGRKLNQISFIQNLFCLSISLDNGGSIVVNVIYFVVKKKKREISLSPPECTRDKSFCN